MTAYPYATREEYWYLELFAERLLMDMGQVKLAEEFAGDEAPGDRGHRVHWVMLHANTYIEVKKRRGPNGLPQHGLTPRGWARLICLRNGEE